MCILIRKLRFDESSDICIENILDCLFARRINERTNVYLGYRNFLTVIMRKIIVKKESWRKNEYSQFLDTFKPILDMMRYMKFYDETRTYIKHTKEIRAFFFRFLSENLKFGAIKFSILKYFLTNSVEHLIKKNTTDRERLSVW